jgi:large-conductance mechanosensitive channel
VENKKVGLLVIGLAILMSIIVLIFNFTLKEITSKSCSMGKECSMYTSITIQTAVSFVIIAIVLIIGLFLVFTKQKEKIIIKTKKEKKKKLN